MKKTLLIIFAALLFAIMVVFSISVITYDSRQTDTIEKSGPAAVRTGPQWSAGHPPSDVEETATSRLSKTSGAAEMSVEDRLVEELKKYYGDTIALKSTQAILLKVRDYIRSLYPEDGDERFYTILKRAFPELADEIIITLDKLEKYNRWLTENQIKLSEMNDLERKGSLWEKRQALFGDDAEEIWSDELFAYEERQQAMKEAIRLLDESYDTSIEEKLDVYISALTETYEGTPEAYFLENRGLLSKVFFGIDSVQKELARMQPDRRQMEINEVRREMGFTQTQIEDHEKIDAYRNQRWENGLNYMKERDALAAQYSGPELEEKLNTLREKFFKHEAVTIEREETDGFFRYKRPRVYGRN